MKSITIHFIDGTSIHIEDYNGEKEIVDGYLILYRAYNPPMKIATENIELYDLVLWVL